jgi:hypothetical protein
MGDAAELEGPGFLIRWRNARPTLETDWQAVAREVGATPELISKFTTVKTGPRTFRPLWRQS